MERVSSPRNPAKMSSSALSTLLFVTICYSLSLVSGKSLGVTRMRSPAAGAGYGLIVEPRDESMNELPRSRMFDEPRNDLVGDDEEDKSEEDIEGTRKRSEERVPRDPPMIPGRVTTADVMRRLMLGNKVVDDDVERRPYVDKRLVFDASSLHEAEQQLLMKEILRELANVKVNVGSNANLDADDVYPNFVSSKPAHHRTVQLLADFNLRQHRYPLVNNDFRWLQQQAPAALPTTSLKRKTPDYYTDEYTRTGGGDIMMRQSRPRIQPLRWG